MQLRTMSMGAAYAEAKHVCRLCAMTVVTPSVRSNVDFPNVRARHEHADRPQLHGIGHGSSDQRMDRLSHSTIDPGGKIGRVQTV